MQRSIATVSLSGTLPEKLEAIAAAGFDGVEIFENDLLYYDGSPREVRQMCADLGIAITLFQPFRDFEGCRRDRLARNLERAERKFDLMQELGTDLVLVCSNASADSVGDECILLDDLSLLAEHAGKRGLRFAFFDRRLPQPALRIGTGRRPSGTTSPATCRASSSEINPSRSARSSTRPRAVAARPGWRSGLRASGACGMATKSAASAGVRRFGSFPK